MKHHSNIIAFSSPDERSGFSIQTPSSNTQTGTFVPLEDWDAFMSTIDHLFRIRNLPGNEEAAQTLSRNLASMAESLANEEHGRKEVARS
jgi:hypothetical protein